MVEVALRGKCYGGLGQERGTLLRLEMADVDGSPTGLIGHRLWCSTVRMHFFLPAFGSSDLELKDGVLDSGCRSEGVIVDVDLEGRQCAVLW